MSGVCGKGARGGDDGAAAIWAGVALDAVATQRDALVGCLGGHGGRRR
eukprot:COSAG02_NODE_2213_length_9490_cov_2.784155_13_plen_47_part_01